MYKYKNKATRALWIKGVGEVKPGAEFESEAIIESVNIETVKGSETKKVSYKTSKHVKK